MRALSHLCNPLPLAHALLAALLLLTVLVSSLLPPATGFQAPASIFLRLFPQVCDETTVIDETLGDEAAAAREL